MQIAYILFIPGLILSFYLVWPFLSILLSALVKEKKVPEAPGEQEDFACIITAYKNAEIALPLIDSLLQQHYSNYIVYLVADDCDIADLTFDNERVMMLKPPKKLGAKVKSILYAMDNFKRAHSSVIIFDPDNLAQADFLQRLNDYLSFGYKAVQGRRVAKNLDTVYACADATGEIYKNHVERYVPYVLGSSPTISGSGMAVKTSNFKEYLQNPQITSRLNADQVIVAEDKILQNDLVSKGFQIAFAKDAIIYDEKIISGSQVERQRSRWLYSYFENLPNSIGFLFKGLFRLNRNQFLFGIFTTSPPLFILLLASCVLALISIFFSIKLFIVITTSIVIFTLNIFLVLKIANAPKEIWKSIWGLPLFVFKQFLALIKMGRSRKDFMHTTHKRKVYLNDLSEKQVD